jgi:HEAT repeat protein
MKAITLKYRVFLFAVVFFSFIFSTSLPVQGKKLSPEELAELRTAKTVQLNLQLPTGSAKNTKFPVRETIAKLLTPAGLKLVPSQGDIVFKIKFSARARSRTYATFGGMHRQTGYTGASVSGNIYVLKGAKEYMNKYFSGSVSPAGSIIKGSYRNPSSAPFSGAFKKSSLRRQVMAILSEIKENGHLLLISFLKSNDTQIRKDAAYSLGFYKDAAVVEALHHALNDKSADVREEAANSLGKIKDPGSLQLLLAALTDNNSKVRKAALSALNRINWKWKKTEAAKNMVPTWISIVNRKDKSKRPGAVEALIETYDQRALKPLIMAMMDSFNTRKKVLKFLDKKSPGWKNSPEADEAVSSFIADLTSPDMNTRRDAIYALGEFKNPRAREPLIKTAVRDNNSTVRTAALSILNKNYPDWGSTQTAINAVPRLINDLNKRSTELNIQAINVLAVIKDQRVVPALIKLMKHRNYRVRGFAITSLGKIDDPRIVKPMIGLLKNPNSTTRGQAVDALAKQTSPAVIEPLIDALNDKKDSVKIKAAKALAKKDDPRVIDPLLALLKEKNTKVKRAAVNALGERKEPRVVKALLELFEDKKSGVNYAVSLALKKMVDVMSPESLMELLKSDNSSLKESAVAALVKQQDPAAIEPLISLLKDKSSTVRLKAVEALGKYEDDRVKEPLIAALQDNYYVVKIAAAKILGERKEPRAVEPLTAILKTPEPKPKRSSRYSRRRTSSTLTSVKNAAFDALKNMAELIPVQTLMELLRDRDWKVSTEAKTLLMETKDPAAVDLFIAELNNKNSSIRKAVLEILGKRKERKAVGPIIDLLQRCQRWEKKRVAAALKAITGKNYGVKYKKWKKWWKKNR